MQTDEEPEQETTPIMLDLETTPFKKGVNKNRKCGIPTDKQKTVEEFQKSDDSLLPPAAIGSNFIERMISDMEVEEQAASTTSIPVVTQPILVKSQKVRPIMISEPKSWMVSRDFIDQKKIKINHCVTKSDGIQVHPTRTEQNSLIYFFLYNKYYLCYINM